MFRRHGAKKKRAPKGGNAGCDESRFAAHGQLAGILHGRLRVSQNKFHGAVNFERADATQNKKDFGRKTSAPEVRERLNDKWEIYQRLPRSPRSPRSPPRPPPP